MIPVKVGKKNSQCPPLPSFIWYLRGKNEESENVKGSETERKWKWKVSEKFEALNKNKGT